MYTKKNLEEFKEMRKQFMSRVEEVLILKVQIVECLKRYRGTIEQVELNNGLIEITTHEKAKCGCCEGENNYYCFPENFLYEESWVEGLKQKINEKREKERILQETEIKKQNEKQEKYEREQYEILKKKYENS